MGTIGREARGHGYTEHGLSRLNIPNTIVVHLFVPNNEEKVATKRQM